MKQSRLNKYVLALLGIVVLLLTLSGCGCEHTFGSWMEETPATCSTEGTKVRICSNCNEIEKDAIPTVEHSYSKGVITDKATCTTTGVKTYTCTACGATKTEEIAKTAHSYGGGKVTTAATCTTTGVKTYTCTACGDTKTAPVTKTAHSYDDGKVTVAATCTTAGIKTYTCTACGDAKTVASAKIAHTYDSGKVTTAATCAKTGTKTITCTTCGITKTEEIAKIAHSYDSGKVTAAATCTKTGTKTITCTACGNTKTETVKALGHTPNSSMRCTRCGVKCTADGKEVQAVWYGEGTYRVGTDIPAGDYYVAATNKNVSGYWCIYQDSRQQKILDNDNFSTFTFVRVVAGQYLKLNRCKITDIEFTPAPPIYDGNTYYDGTYRVGIDIPAGEYKFMASTNVSGYYCVYTDISYEDIVDNDNFNNNAYYTVENGQILQVNRADFYLIEPAGTGNRDLVYYAGYNGVPDFGKMYDAEPFVNTGDSFQYFESDVGSATKDSYIKLLESEGFVYHSGSYVLSTSTRKYVNNSLGLMVSVSTMKSPLGNMIVIRIDPA